MSSSNADREPVELLAEEFLERRRRGEKPTIQEYTEKYPQLSDEIRDVFPTLLLMEDVDPGTEELRASTADTVAVRRTPMPDRVGDYRILREIGRGAMGVVYEAEQQSLGRRVALKVLPRQLAADERALVRFRREARAAARLHHTNIVPVFEVGQDGDTLFYAMQYIQGQSLDKVLAELRHVRNGGSEGGVSADNVEARTAALSLCRGRFGAAGALPGSEDNDVAATEDLMLPTSGGTARSSGASAELPVSRPSQSANSLSGVHARVPDYFFSVARICQQAASALSYAHERNTVHRDIKPSNLLLDTAGVLWVADFGLAKFEEDGHTRTGDLVGTFRYMSPERFQGQYDARTDIYALGATLYELLVLRPAFESLNQLELLDQISNLPPRRPRGIDPSVPRDLETIALKAMEKNPANRYQAARELGEDLRRFIQDEPIRARKPSPVERFIRWGRRNQAVATLTVAIFLLSTILSLVLAKSYISARAASERIISQFEDATRARVIAEVSEKLAQRNQYISDMYAADVAWQASDTLLVDRLLARYRVEEGRPDLRSFEWYYLYREWAITPAIRQANLPWRTVRLAVSPDANHLAAASMFGAHVSVWDLRTNQQIQEFGQPAPTTFQQTVVAFSHDGATLAYPSDDYSEVILSDLKGNTTKRIPLGSGKQLRLAAYSPIDSVLATADGGNDIRLWNAISGDLIAELKTHDAPVSALAYSFSGDRLASADVNGGLAIWLSSTQQLGIGFKGHERTVNSVAFSPDGKRLASASSDGNVKVWDSESGRLEHGFPTFPDEARCVAFSPQGTALAAAGRDHVIRLWDATTYEDWGVIRNYGGNYAFGFVADGRLAFGNSRGITICEIKRVPPDWVKASEESINSLFATKSSNDALFVGAVSYPMAAVRIWRVDQNGLSECSSIEPGFRPSCVGATPEGLVVVGEAGGHQVAIYDLSQMKFVQRLRTLTTAGIAAAAISADGQWIAVGCADGRIARWKLNKDGTCDPAGKVEFVAHSALVECLAFDATASLLASGGKDKHLKVWDVGSSTLKRDLGEQEAWVQSVAFSPDGDRLAAGFFSREIKVWRWPSGEIDCTLVGHYMSGTQVSFLQDRRTLVSAGTDRLVKLWDLDTQQERFNLRGGRSIFQSLAISPDEKTIMAGTRDGLIRVYRAAAEEEMKGEF